MMRVFVYVTVLRTSEALSKNTLRAEFGVNDYSYHGKQQREHNKKMNEGIERGEETSTPVERLNAALDEGPVTETPSTSARAALPPATGTHRSADAGRTSGNMGIICVGRTSRSNNHDDGMADTSPCRSFAWCC
jgi:hypothetical protein